MDLLSVAARLAGLSLADLSPPLGDPGGPCQVIHRIEDSVQSPKLRNDLVKEVESNRPLSNKDAGQVYEVDVEPGVGTRKKIHIGPHAQFRMDLRSVTVGDIQNAVREFFKRLNDLKSRQHPSYSRYYGLLSRGEKVEWTSSDDVTVVMAETGPDSLFIVTAYQEGVPDPVAKPGKCGSPDVELPPPSRP